MREKILFFNEFVSLGFSTACGNAENKQPANDEETIETDELPIAQAGTLNVGNALRNKI